MDAVPLDLRRLFAAVAQALEDQRAALNAADEINCNHGDHMLQVFHLAAQGAGETPPEDLALAMVQAANRLQGQADNGLAQEYARGLHAFAGQFAERGVTLPELAAYVRHVVQDKDGPPPSNSGETLKALVQGLGDWKRASAQAANGELDGLTEAGFGSEKGFGKEMGFLFELGLVYMQAKSRGGTRSQVLADAAASASPLAQVPYRYESGKLALTAFLEALTAAAESSEEAN